MNTMIHPPLPKAGLPCSAISDLTLKLVGRRQETSDVTTFVFEVITSSQEIFRHLPGQAVALTFNMPGGPETRTFTIASSGLESDIIEVTVKVGPHAFATSWAHENLKIGDTLQGRGPIGQFSVVHSPNKPLVLIGAGSGLTPVMSMLRWLHGRQEETDIVFIQAASTLDDLLFEEELSKITSDMPFLRRFNCVSKIKVEEDWSGYRGRLDDKKITTMVPDIKDRTIFCCGPDNFMKTIRQIAEDSGCSKEQFKTESFGVALPIEDVSERPNKKSSSHLKATLDGFAFDAFEDHSLVYSAALAGKRIPTGCGEGICGTCRVQLLEGSVEMQHQGGLSDVEQKDGFILACCSKPKTDVVLKSR